MIRSLIKFCLLFLLLGTGLYVATAQEGVGQEEPEDTAAQAKDAFRVTLTLSQNTILPYEPLTAVVKFRNISGQAQKVRTFWFHGVYVRRGEDGPWVSAFRGRGAASPPPFGEIAFEPGEGETFYWPMDLNQEHQHLFAQPGTYWLKAVNAAWESEPIRLEVQPVPDEETEALKSVVEGSLFEYFLRGDAASRNLKQPQLEKEVLQLQAVATKFPRSRYGQWCRLGSLLLERSLAQEDGNNFARVQAAHDALTAAAPTLPPPLNAIAWFEAGLTAQANAGKLFVAKLTEQGTQQDEVAEADFQKAIDTKAIADMEEQARRVRTRQRASPSPSDIFEKTRKELEGLGYDIPNFGKNYPEVFKEFLVERGAIHELYGKGAIPLPELYRREAELLRKYMTERTKPTLKKP